MELARIEEREEKIALSKAKKHADLMLLDDEADDFKVKISMEDFEILRRAKLQQCRQVQLCLSAKPNLCRL